MDLSSQGGGCEALRSASPASPACRTDVRASRFVHATSGSLSSDFGRIFASTAERLPALYLSFWHRWEIAPGDPQALLVYSDRGTATLRIERTPQGYWVYGLERGSRQIYAAAAPTLQAALRCCGLG